MNKIKELFTFIGLDYKKELIKLSIINAFIIILTIILYTFLKHILILLVGITLLIAANGFIYTLISSKKNQIILKRDEEFITLITYFQSFISNGQNVYTAFKSCIEYSSIWMKEQLNELLMMIDENKTVTPFLSFAKKFTKSYVETTMISIFQMVDEGENNEHLQHFNAYFDQIILMNKKEKIDRKKKSLEVMPIFPLIGAGIITILMTLGIITIIGDMVNVF